MRKPKTPHANRTRILDAAAEIFAARGFAGASMDAIAAKTQTTRALINYYFGSKEALYIEVLEQSYAEIREAEASLPLDHLPPLKALQRIVDFTFDYYVEHPCFVRLLVAENQAEGVHMRQSEELRTVNRPIVERLAAILSAGAASGDFRSDIDLLDVHMAISALGIFNVTHQHTFGALFQREMGAEGDLARRRTVVADIVLSWLRPQPAPAPRKTPTTPTTSRRP